MSKSTIMKLLQGMSKDAIIEMVLELYSARKEAKEYLDFYVGPDEKGNSKSTRASSMRSSILKDGVSHRHAFSFAERLWLTSRNSSRPLMPAPPWFIG